MAGVAETSHHDSSLSALPQETNWCENALKSDFYLSENQIELYQLYRDGCIYDVDVMDRPSSLPAVLRSIAWVTSVAAMVVCGYILHKWPEYGNAVATGVVGVCCFSVAIQRWEC